MKIIRTAILMVLVTALVLAAPVGDKIPLKDEFGNKAGAVDARNVFKEIFLQNAEVLIEPQAMHRQIDEILEYFRKYKESDSAVVNEGILAQLGVTLAKVEATMIYMRSIIAEDQAKGKSSRLKDPGFLKKHFRIFRWRPWGGKHDESGKIRITKYAMFTVKGNNKIIPPYTCALYALPNDEKGMSLEEAEKNKHRLNRFKYTKQQVLAGAYEKGGAVPLVWLTRSGLEEALMEGSICVLLPNGKKKFFNVDRNNGILYNRAIKNPKNQQRYWYFGEVSGPQGYGRDIRSQVTIFPEVVFAGDVYNLGLGKIIGMSYKDVSTGKDVIRLGILADTGGAFTPNLHQLDYFAGVFASRQDFKTKIKALPRYADIFLFIKR